MNSSRVKRRLKCLRGQAALLGLLLLAAVQAATAAVIAERPLHILGAGRLTRTALSPDGTRLLTGAKDGIGRLWDAATGALLQIYYGHENEILAVAFSPDGKLVATGSGASDYTRDYTARIFDAASGRQLRVLRGAPGTNLGFEALAFSPDGQQLLSGNSDGKARLWDVATGSLLRALEGHTGAVGAVAFSAYGPLRALTGAADATARLWDVDTGQLVKTFSGGHTAAITAVAFSPMGTQALTGSADGKARLWDVASGQFRAVAAHTSAMLAATFSPDGKWVLTSSSDTTAKLWDIVGSQGVRVFTGHTGVVNAAAFTPDGARIMTASGAITRSTGSTGDDTVRFWDVASQRQLQLFADHKAASPQQLAFSPDSRKVLIAGGNTPTTTNLSALLFDVATGTLLRTFSVKGVSIASAAFSPDGTKVLTGGLDGTARLFDAATGALLQSYPVASDIVFGVAFSADGNQVYTTYYRTSLLVIWDTATGTRQRDFSINGKLAALSPDNTLALVLSSMYGVTPYDMATGKSLRNIWAGTGSSGSFPRSTEFTPDGACVVVANASCPAAFYDAATGQWLRSFADQNGWRSAGVATVSKNGKLLLTGSALDDRKPSGVAKLWDVATGDELQIYPGHVGGVALVAVSPDGRYALTASGGAARLWEVTLPPAAAHGWAKYD